jgi:hypothetical protein
MLGLLFDPPKRRVDSELRSVITQKTVVFTVTAERTSNPTYCREYLDSKGRDWNMEILYNEELHNSYFSPNIFWMMYDGMMEQVAFRARKKRNI